MPELPEVEITRIKLTAIVGKTISRFWTDVQKNIQSPLPPGLLSKEIQGYTISALSRTGKVLFFSLNKADRPPATIAFHQRMSGRFQIMPNKHNPAKHTRIILTFTDQTQLHFIDPRKFGVAWYGHPDKVQDYPYLQALGPDALSIPEKLFYRRMRGKKGRIKPVLLRQDIVAGIGNIIADETLWESRIHPLCDVQALATCQLKHIHTSLQKVLAASIAAKGSTLRDWKHPDNERGMFVDLMNVYGRKDKPCKRCGTSITRIVVAGRGTWICTQCQILV